MAMPAKKKNNLVIALLIGAIALTFFLLTIVVKGGLG